MTFKITVKRASALLNKDVSAIYHMIDDGVITGYRNNGRILVDNNEIGRIRMLESGLTPTDVAERLNVGIATVKRWDASNDDSLLHHAYSYNGRNYYLLADVENYKSTYLNQRKKATV